MKTEKNTKQGKTMSGCTPQHLLLINLRILSGRSVQDINLMTQYTIKAERIRKDYDELIDLATTAGKTSSSADGVKNNEFDQAFNELTKALEDAYDAINYKDSIDLLEAMKPIDTALCKLQQSIKRMRGEAVEESRMNQLIQLKREIYLCAGDSVPDWAFDDYNGTVEKDLFFRMVGLDLSTGLDSGKRKKDKKAFIEILVRKVYPVLMKNNPAWFRGYFQDKTKRLSLLTSILYSLEEYSHQEIDNDEIFFSINQSSLDYQALEENLDPVSSAFSNNFEEFGDILYNFYLWLVDHADRRTGLFIPTYSSSSVTDSDTLKPGTQPSENTEHSGTPVFSHDGEYEYNIVYFTAHIMNYMVEIGLGAGNSEDEAEPMKKKRQLADLTSDILESCYWVFYLAFSNEPNIDCTTYSIICEERFYVLQLIIKDAYRRRFSEGGIV